MAIYSVENVRNWSFDLIAHAFLHIDTVVLTNCAGKMVELSYFGSVSLLDVFLLLRSVISVSLENTEVEIELQKNGYMPKKKKMSVWHYFFDCTLLPVSRFVTFLFHPSAPLLSDVLCKWTLLFSFSCVIDDSVQNNSKN